MRAKEFFFSNVWTQTLKLIKTYFQDHQWIFQRALLKISKTTCSEPDTKGSNCKALSCLWYKRKRNKSFSLRIEKENKSPGDDDIVIYAIGDDTLVSIFQNRFKTFLIKGITPFQWYNALFIVMYKNCRYKKLPAHLSFILFL